MKWIPREKVKEDRQERLWLLKKYAEPHAELIVYGSTDRWPQTPRRLRARWRTCDE